MTRFRSSRFNVQWVGMFIAMALFHCHQTAKEKDRAEIGTETRVVAIAPKDACPLFDKHVASLQKWVCANPNTPACSQFSLFAQGEVPKFSASDRFTMGPELTLPVEGGPPVNPDNGRIYMILGIKQDAGAALVLGIADAIASNDDQAKATQAFVTGTLPANSPFSQGIQNAIKFHLDNMNYQSVMPCSNGVYFSTAGMKLFDILIRQKGNMTYVLGIFYADDKREKMEQAILSYMIEPKALFPTNVPNKTEPVVSEPQPPLPQPSPPVVEARPVPELEKIPVPKEQEESVSPTKRKPPKKALRKGRAKKGK